MLVIPNGIDPPAARRPAAEARALLGLPLDPGVRIVGQVSGLVQFKGHLVLLEAAKRVLEAQPNTAFLFVGYVKRDQEYVQRLERKAAELGLSGRVRIAPYPGAIGDVWNIIDVHVHASLFDSLPNAIIEGMSLGKPAVVTNVGGVPEMVEDGRTGLVVPVNDPVALARALVELLERPGLAVRLGRAAREKYIERCRPDVMARQLEECFLQLARRRLQTTTS
jgi:glycosyltransferase involved in cell wall biosynthesis